MGKTTAKHLQACSKYKKAYLDSHGYLSCEVCGRSNAFRYNVHHIIYASRAPRHPQLHNPRNLILVCDACHEGFHSGKLKDMYLELEKFRGLKELFGKL
jgi:predicted HNH restriction endonuclease